MNQNGQFAASPQDFQQLFAINPLAASQLEAIVLRRHNQELMAEIERMKAGVPAIHEVRADVPS